MGCKAAETPHNIHSAFGSGTANKRIVQGWFKKFCKGDESLEDEEYSCRPSEVWNRSPAQVGCMRQVLGPGALGRPRGIGQRGKWEWGSGWGIHVNPWLIHVNVWQKPLQYYKVISLQLIKINRKKKKLTTTNWEQSLKLIPLQLHKKLPRKSTLTILQSFGIWNKL